jgi:uncharacterized protein
MKIDELLWPEDRVEHIARHGVAPKKWRKCASGNRWCAAGNPVENTLYTMCRDEPKQVVIFICVIIEFPDGNGYPVTARAMTAKEKRRYRNWKNR